MNIFKVLIFFGRYYDVVNFDGYNSMGNLKIVSYTWTFQYTGEEVILFSPDLEFKFDEHGSYNVTLRVKDKEGNIDKDHVNVEVDKKDTPGYILPILLILLAGIGIIYRYYIYIQKK